MQLASGIVFSSWESYRRHAGLDSSHLILLILTSQLAVRGSPHKIQNYLLARDASCADFFLARTRVLYNVLSHGKGSVNFGCLKRTFTMCVRPSAKHLTRLEGLYQLGACDKRSRRLDKRVTIGNASPTRFIQRLFDVINEEACFEESD